MNDETQPILSSIERGVALVRLNRPEALNAMSGTLMDALAATLEEIERSREARVIVITGDDRAFAAGGDLAAMREMGLADVLVAQASNRFWRRVAAIELPLVAAVSGYAFGGGCELALACDLIVASDTAMFSQSELAVGIIPGGGGTQRLTRIIGKHRAMEMILTGQRVGAVEAAELGFVNRVVPDGRWLEEALELAAVIAAKPPLAVLLAKRAVIAADETAMTAGLAFERRLYEVAMATEDRVEGMNAFLDRREPHWRGR